MRKKRALSTYRARKVRQRGHDDAFAFALKIGLSSDYENNPQAKKDVVDLSKDSHSVKSGNAKWQIFLYRASRFETDDAFRVMNGVGKLLTACINAFPATYKAYRRNKSLAKLRLRKPMRKLATKLKNKVRLRAFISKSMFNGGEVDYLTVKHDGKYHVFWNQDISKVLAENLEVCNSTARQKGQVSEQKVIFRFKGKNLGELEMRNDSETHYREVRFNMLKGKAMDLFFQEIPLAAKYSRSVWVYGSAVKRFKRWK